MKYLIWISCCLLTACGLSQQGGLTATYEKTLPTVSGVCPDMYTELKEDSSLPLANTFDVEVDLEDIGTAAAPNVVFYAVCHQGSTLPILHATGPGYIEIKGNVKPTVFVRLTATSAVQWTLAGSVPKSPDRAPSVDLIDNANVVPSPGNWTSCEAKSVHDYDPSRTYPSNVTHQYIWFSLCSPAQSATGQQLEKDYYYRVVLAVTKNGKVVPTILDPPIHHYP